MDRRQFLKVTGLVAATAALGAVPAAPAAAATLEAVAGDPVRNRVSVPSVTVTRLAMRAPGEYRVSGLVRFDSETVTIDGLANSQQISRSGSAPMVVGFTSFETYDGSGPAPAVTVRGGRIESLSVTPVSFD
jgi:hypothetical protein